MLACIPVFSWLWFSKGGDREAATAAQVEVDWSAAPGRIRYEAIAERSRTLLRYTDGRHGWWQEPGGMRIDLYEFGWEAGRISSFGEIHRPDVCLPASGFELATRDERWRTIVVGGKSLAVERFSFEEGAASLFVYFCAWDLDAGGDDVPLVTGIYDRLSNAWRGRRVEGRRVVQVLVSGAPSAEASDVAVEGWLRRVLR